MIDWFGFTLVAMLFFALQNFFQKSAMQQKCNSAKLMTVILGLVGLLALASALVTGDTWVNSWDLFFVLAAANGFFFLTGAILRLESLKYIPLVVMQPIKKMDGALAALAGVIIFGEVLSIPQIAGIALAVAVVWILARDRKSEKPEDFAKGVLLILAAVLLFTGSDVVMKPGVAEGSVFMFIAISYLVMFFPSLLLKKKVSKGRTASLETTLKWGMLLGGLNFFAITSLLNALRTGALSIIFPILSLGVVLTSGMGVLFHKEELTVNRIIGTGLAVVVLVLMSM